MGKNLCIEGKVQFQTVRKIFKKNRSSLCCQPLFSVFISTVGQLFKSDVKRCQNPIGSTANGVCLSRAMCWLTACSVGLTWVGYFLLLLQHLLQTWLRLFSTVVAKHLELLNKKLFKKKKACFEDTGHTSFKHLLGIQITVCQFAFLLQSQR